MKRCFTCLSQIPRGKGLTLTYDFGKLHFCDAIEGSEFHKGYTFGLTEVGQLAASKWNAFASKRRKELEARP